MRSILTKLGRTLWPASDERTVHLHAGSFWTEDDIEVCFDPDCGRPVLPVE